MGWENQKMQSINIGDDRLNKRQTSIVPTLTVDALKEPLVLDYQFFDF